MNLEQLRARLAEIMAQLGQYDGKENFEASEIEAVDALSVEVEALQKQIETCEKLEAMKAKVAAPAPRQVAASLPAKVEVGASRQSLDPKAGFQSSGEFYRSVIQAAHGTFDKRLTVQGGAMEKVGEDGGFLIPTDFRQEILKKVTGDESLLSRTTQFKTASNNLELPTNETAPWDSSGVINATWEGEGTEPSDSKAKFGLTQFRLNKLTALVRVTSELLEDAPALESWIKANAPDAMVHKINKAIIAGTGVGQPLGILNSGFKYELAGEGGQTADTVNFQNINKMFGRLLPMSIRNAVWLIHPALLPQVREMRFDLASDTPVPVYLPAAGISGAPYGTLMGLPILPMMAGVKAPGDAGDIMLVDLKYYYSVIKTAGMKSEVSTHVHFKTDEQLFKFQMRLGGQVPYKAPVTTENGAFDMSGIVTLGAR